MRHKKNDYNFILNKNCYYNVCIGNVIDKELSKLLISI